jgi:hypothetical protein
MLGRPSLKAHQGFAGSINVIEVAILGANGSVARNNIR